MQLLIQAMEAEVTQEELRKNLPPETMKELEGKVVHPYVIAEEGESRPKVLGEGAKTLSWPRATIRRLAQVAKKGTKLFVGHNKDSSHTDRPSVGKVVGTYTRTVAGKLQALAITVLEKTKQDLDVCSIEADVEMSLAGVVGDVTKLTGIALGSSDKDSPAFPGAKRMGIIQCFGETEDGGTPLEKGDKTVKFADVQQAIKDLNIHPWQLFTMDDIKNDREFGKVFDDLTKKATDFESKFNDLDKQSKDSIKKTQVTEAKAKFEKLIPEGSTDKQKDFYLNQFDPEKLEDLSEEGLKKEVGSLQKQYSDFAKLFGDGGKGQDDNGNKGNDNKTKDENLDPVNDALKEIVGE